MMLISFLISLNRSVFKNYPLPDIHLLNIIHSWNINFKAKIPKIRNYITKYWRLWPTKSHNPVDCQQIFAITADVIPLPYRMAPSLSLFWPHCFSLPTVDIAEPLRQCFIPTEVLRSRWDVPISLFGQFTQNLRISHLHLIEEVVPAFIQ